MVNTILAKKGQSYCSQRGQSCLAKRVKVAWLFQFMPYTRMVSYWKVKRCGMSDRTIGFATMCIALKWCLPLLSSCGLRNVWLSESLSWKNCIPPVGKNHYTCSFRQRHIPERSITVDVKDIRPDTVRNTTRGHQVVFLLCTTMDAI